MDHQCYKCGQNIEDGKPFCPQCGAPQIRVAIPEAAVELAHGGDIAAPALGRELSLEASGIPEATSRYRAQPAALAAGVALLLIPLGLNPFVAALGTGFLAVVFARRRSAGNGIRTAAGARLGALSGMLFFGVLVFLVTLAVAVSHKGAEVRSQFIDKLQQAMARYPGPDVQSALDFARSPSGLVFLLGASLIFGFLACIALGAIGGALGASFLGRRDPP
ncbi:MAG: hypothetical protein WAN65_15945 [Candidatus Sulfotelmatobacter sp.]